MKAMAGENAKVFSYNISLDGQEQKLPSPYINSYYLAPLSLDLEPEEYRVARLEKGRAKKHRQSYLVFIGGLLLAVYTANQYMTNASNLDRDQKKYGSKNKILKLQTEAAESDAKSYQPQADQLKLAFEPAQQPGDVLKVVSSVVPSDTWLTGMTFERGKLLVIRGISKKPELVSAYVLELSKQPRFRDVRLITVNSGEIGGVPTVTFNITAFPIGNLPMIPASKKKK